MKRMKRMRRRDRKIRRINSKAAKYRKNTKKIQHASRSRSARTSARNARKKSMRSRRKEEDGDGRNGTGRMREQKDEDEDRECEREEEGTGQLKKMERTTTRMSALLPASSIGIANHEPHKTTGRQAERIRMKDRGLKKEQQIEDSTREDETKEEEAEKNGKKKRKRRITTPSVLLRTCLSQICRTIIPHRQTDKQRGPHLIITPHIERVCLITAEDDKKFTQESNQLGKEGGSAELCLLV